MPQAQLLVSPVTDTITTTIDGTIEDIDVGILIYTTNAADLTVTLTHPTNPTVLTLVSGAAGGNLGEHGGNLLWLNDAYPTSVDTLTGGDDKTG
jgi:subtilisin-like proprotein convertase family protein